MRVKPGQRTQLIRTWRSPLEPKDPSQVQGLKELVLLYCDWMKTVNYAHATIRGRERQLLLFVEWCGDRGVAELKQINTALVERYPKHLYQAREERSGKRRSSGAQSQHLMAVREFFRWSYRKKYLAFNPASEIDLPRPERRIPRKVLTPREVEKMLALAELGTPEGVRDRAILETFYSTGIRREELANLWVTDIHEDPGTLVVRLGKGKKDRMVPIGKRALKWIEKYIIEVRPLFAQRSDEPEALFLNSDGSPIKPDTLSAKVHGYIERAGVAKRGACHMLRHAMATAMLDNGADLRFIQQMLGHVDISATQIYTRVSLRKLREVYSATHPGAHLRRPKKRRKRRPPSY